MLDKNGHRCINLLLTVFCTPLIEIYWNEEGIIQLFLIIRSVVGIL